MPTKGTTRKNRKNPADLTRRNLTPRDRKLGALDDRITLLDSMLQNVNDRLKVVEDGATHPGPMKTDETP